MTGPVVVGTPAGAVEGTAVSEGVAVFRGLRYAAARRWESPRPVPAWGGVQDCSGPGPVCPQPRGFEGPLERWIVPGGHQTEDCLTVDVWAPLSLVGTRPVIAFLHGGGFWSGGAGALPWPVLATEGCVVVAINYRLGPLGFLGGDRLWNLGLRDQLAALTWMQQSIAAFGGDPGRVTLVGHSSGAMSAAALLASPLAVGLFQRMVAMSGSADAWMTADTAGVIADSLAGATDLDDLLSRSLALQGAAPTLVPGPAPPLPFMPIVGDDVVPIAPIDGIANGAGAGVELVVGTCADELRYPVFALPAAIRSRLPAPDARRFFGERADAASTTYLSLTGGSEMAAACALQTDGWFTVPSARLAAAHRRHGRTQRYVVTRRGPGELGACHGSDLLLLAGVDAPDLLGPSPAPVADAFRRDLLSFATAGHWPSSGADEDVLTVGATTVAPGDPKDDRRALWEGVFPALPPQ